MSCPKCGYGGHNKVFHSGTGEVECENCRHDYVRNKKSKKEGSESFELPLFDLGKEIRSPNNTYIWGKYDKVSRGTMPIGGKYVGKTSGLLWDNDVKDHRGYTVGKINGAGYFQRLIL